MPQTLTSLRLASRTRGQPPGVSLSTKNKALAITFARETDTEPSVGQRYTPMETLIHFKATLLSLWTAAYAVSLIDTADKEITQRLHSWAHLVPKPKQQAK